MRVSDRKNRKDHFLQGPAWFWSGSIGGKVLTLHHIFAWQQIQLVQAANGWLADMDASVRGWFQQTDKRLQDCMWVARDLTRCNSVATSVLREQEELHGGVSDGIAWTEAEVYNVHRTVLPGSESELGSPSNRNVHLWGEQVGACVESGKGTSLLEYEWTANWLRSISEHLN